MTKLGKDKIPSKKVRPPARLVVMNLNKGLNNLVSPSLIDNREFSDLLNVEYDEGGVVRKRTGYDDVANALTAARGLGVYRTESLNLLVTVDSGTIKYRSTGNWTAATGATMTAANDTSMTQARLKLFLWNGVDSGVYFTGTAATQPGTMPKAKFSVYFQSKHICSGVDGQPSRLYISNLTDATDFTVTTGGTQPQPDSTTDSENSNANVPGATVFAGTPALTEANVIDIRKNDGDKITGLAVFQDVLIVFKERAIYQVDFAADGTPTVTPITYATGCISHKSIVNVENDVYFMSREGLRVLGNEPQFFTAIRTQVLSIRIQPVVDGIAKAYYTRANGIYFDNKYILAHPTGSTSTIAKCIVYDRRFQAFTVWTNFNAQAMVKFIETDNSESLYFLDDGGTQMYKRVAGTYNDNGAAIEAYIVTKAQDFGNPDITKFWIDFRPVFRRVNGVVTLTVYTDDNVTLGTATVGSGSTRGMGLNMLGSFQLGSDGESASSTSASFADNPQSVVLNLDSRTLKFKIYNNRLDENFVFLGVVYNYYPKSPFVFDSSRKVYVS